MQTAIVEQAKNVLFDNMFFDNVAGFAIFSKVNFNYVGECKENTFRKYVCMADGRGNPYILVRGHGRIGMTGFRDKIKWYDPFYRINEIGFQMIKVQYMNAEHLIFNQPISMLGESVKQLLMYLLDEYMPTGILSMNQINDAEQILANIRSFLFNLEIPQTWYSKQFYEKIPQNGNLKRLELINDHVTLWSKQEALQRLRSALESIYNGVQSSMNPIDYFTRNWLKTQLTEVQKGSNVFRNLATCIEKTQHKNSKFLKLSNIFSVSSWCHTTFDEKIGNQHLLYHFTFPSNILGILREGLMVAPPHIYSENRFMGDGIYFWDCASIALQGFEKYQPNNTVLLICRVALGNQQQVPAMYLRKGDNFQFPLMCTDSLFYEGSHYPNTRKQSVVLNNATMFCGEIPNCYSFSTFDSYNKYMITNEDQVKVEYIAQFERI